MKIQVSRNICCWAWLYWRRMRRWRPFPDSEVDKGLSPVSLFVVIGPQRGSLQLRQEAIAESLLWTPPFFLNQTLHYSLGFSPTHTLHKAQDQWDWGNNDWMATELTTRWPHFSGEWPGVYSLSLWACVHQRPSSMEPFSIFLLSQRKMSQSLLFWIILILCLFYSRDHQLRKLPKIFSMCQLSGILWLFTLYFWFFFWH